MREGQKKWEGNEERGEGKNKQKAEEVKRIKEIVG